ncbi:hypothetical protein F8388_017801 [Cannabis sativa]|uniref:Uncharacterized protein n=1 Tax=Cannabis sativa TaxID=3483 RepID=A0A7J6EQA3_CANSA|nr:hypothetical protein G4B88_015826 [Cannabis sativa]KAF4365235.1 hypothetical protein F8388_017801 [Cannabis sativa]
MDFPGVTATNVQHHSANITTAETVSDDAWYPDAGATTHCTPNVSNFTQKQPYLGSDQVQMGDGASLPIQNIGGRALNNFIQLHSSDQSQSEIYSQDGKIVTIIEPASLQEVLFESLSQKNQCWGKFCAPWSPCQPGCVCVGAVGTGACIGPSK